MSKWVLRLTGLLVISLLALLFLHKFLNPDVPDYIDQGVDVQMQGEDGRLQPAKPTENDEPALSLTSLEGDNAQATNVDDSANIAQPEPKLQITALEERKTIPVLSNPDSNRANAWLQAGSFGELANANKRAAVLEAQGWSVDIESAVVKGKTYHRVYIGPLTHNQVDGYLKTLDKMGIKAREVTR